MKASLKVLKASLVLSIAATCLVGCDNHTTTSICNEANSPIEGITGVYELNSRRDQDTFGVHTQRVEIYADKNAKGTVYTLRSDDKMKLKIDICNIGGAYVFEGYSEGTPEYSTGRFYVSQVGVHFAPFVFDKTKLDAAGIPNVIVVTPQAIRSWLGESVSSKIDVALVKVMSIFANDDESKELVIDNSKVSPSELIKLAVPSSFGITAFRK